MCSARIDRSPTVFEALIVPHRSLTPKGVSLLIMLLIVLVGLIALRFWLLGAWPVVAFSLFDVPLVCLLLALNFRGARASELIMLTSLELTVIRTDPRGRRLVFSLPAAWLRVEHDMVRGASRILLRYHGHVREIGAFLHEAEKASLCAALRSALHEVRNPWFDNPQLRDRDDAGP
jgi:uncharacterized membrane protein